MNLCKRIRGLPSRLGIFLSPSVTRLFASFIVNNFEVCMHAFKNDAMNLANDSNMCQCGLCRFCDP